MKPGCHTIIKSEVLNKISNFLSFYPNSKRGALIGAQVYLKTFLKYKCKQINKGIYNTENQLIMKMNVFFVDIQEDGPHHFKKQKPLQVLNLQGFFVCGARKGAQFFRILLQFLDLTYPCYMINSFNKKSSEEKL
jgi:hypothetical protein